MTVYLCCKLNDSTDYNACISAMNSAQTENICQLWYDNTFPSRVELLRLKTSYSPSSRTLRKLERWRGKKSSVWEDVGEDSKSFQEFCSYCTTLHCLHAPAGENRGFAEKGDHFTIKMKAFSVLCSKQISPGKNRGRKFSWYKQGEAN